MCCTGWGDWGPRYTRSWPTGLVSVTNPHWAWETDAALTDSQKPRSLCNLDFWSFIYTDLQTHLGRFVANHTLKKKIENHVKLYAFNCDVCVDNDSDPTSDPWGTSQNPLACCQTCFYLFIWLLIVYFFRYQTLKCSQLKTVWALFLVG